MARDRDEDHLYASGADGTRLRQIESQPGCKQDPDWSPDGGTIAYRYLPRCNYRENRIFVIDVRDGQAEDLTAQSGIQGNSPSWSPDGAQIAFSGQTGPRSHLGIYVMNRDGTRPRRLTPPDMEAQYPAWSPDGTKIAFHVASETGFDIYVMNSDGSNMKPLVVGPTQDEWPMWSPSGNSIAFGREGERSEIRMVDLDGGDESRVTDRGGVPANWAPGSWIVFNCIGSSGKTIVICAIRPDGTGFTRLPLRLGDKGAGFPAWRPE